MPLNFFFFFSPFSTVAENTLKPTSRSIGFFFVFFYSPGVLLVSKVNLCGYEPGYSAIQPDRWSLSRRVNPILDDFNPKVVPLFFFSSLSSAGGIFPRSLLLSWAGERSRAGSSCPSDRETQQETPLAAAVLVSSTRAGRGG